MGPATSNGSFRQNLLQLAWFVLSVVLLSLAMSVCVKPWLDLTLWKIFRRCVSISSLIVLAVFLRRVHHQSVGALGLASWSSGRRELLLGLGVGCLGGFLLTAVFFVAGIWHIDLYPDIPRIWGVVLVSLPAMILVAILEELIFRGYVLQRLLSCQRGLAVFGSSAAYAFVHLRTTLVWPGTVLELIGLCLLGCLLALTALRTNQLYASIGLHASLAYWARINKFVVGVTDGRLPWLVGSNKLIDGLAAWLLLAFMWGAVVVLVRKRST